MGGGKGMTHIICRASSCLFWEDGICTSEEIEYEPDVGCLTFQDVGDLELEDEDDEFDWDEKDSDLFDDDDWDDDEEEEDDDDDWDDL
jgi:hypothetical protein